MNKRLYKEISNYQPFDEREKLDKEVMLDFIKNNSHVLERKNRIGHFTTSAWIVNKDKTKVLMIHHNIYNSWAWVGGHADGCDDLLFVIKKEIKEETGINDVKLLSDGIYGLNVVTVDNHVRRGKIVSSHLHFDVEYLFMADDSVHLQIKKDENSGVKWVNLDEVNNYTTEEKMKPIYDRLTQKLCEKNR